MPLFHEGHPGPLHGKALAFPGRSFDFSQDTAVRNHTFSSLSSRVSHCARAGFVVRIAILSSIVGAAMPVHAQVTLRTVVTDIGRGAGDIWHVWTAPFHAERRDWRDAGLVAGATLALAPADRAVDRWIAGHPAAFPIAAVRPFREGEGIRAADFGTGRILLPLSAALYTTGFATRTRALRDAGVGLAASQQANSVIRHLTYEVVSRERPSTAEGRAYDIRFPGGEWKYHSFFGGHVANAFATAGYLGERFELGLVEPVLYASATGIGLARMADRRHWVSDTFLGAAVGYSIGRSVATRQRNRLADERAARGSPVEDEQQRSALGRLTRGLYATTSRDAGAVVGWRGTF